MSFFPWNKKNKEKNKEKSGNVGKLNKAHFILILDTFNTKIKSVITFICKLFKHRHYFWI